MLAFFTKLDVALFYLINGDGQNAFFDQLMPIVSNVNYFFIPMALGVLYLVVKKGLKGRAVALAIIALIGLTDWSTTKVFKPAFNRPRPYHALSGVHLHKPDIKTWQVTPQLKTVLKGKSYSMPSTHATNIFAGAFLISFFFRRGWPLFYLIALTVGYSRVYLGAHHPFDVLGGALLGTFFAACLAWITQKSIAFIETRWPAFGAGEKVR
jgi:membrane-associated phospholipid phosphatase